MNIMFNPGDVFDIAVCIERNGTKFYRKAAEYATGDIQQELLHLAAMEVDHEKTFLHLKSKLPAEIVEATSEEEEESFLYLQTFSQGQVFDMTVDPSEKITPETSLKEVLEMALGRERDSVVFFLGIKVLVPELLGRNLIDDIIRQEMGHITLLSRRLATVK